ncbi:hypothetical protein [Pseudomonas sp. EL_65y_Pfl2_R96]|uniref:hypothetical protein n=1 Tax=Pseudomonas sp. EL_65y_Pfl2_R96 TaxID=3088699 RepID=UPI0030D7E93A
MSVVESVVVFPEPMTGAVTTALKVGWRLAFAPQDGPMIKGERVSMEAAACGQLAGVERFGGHSITFASKPALTFDRILM